MTPPNPPSRMTAGTAEGRARQLIHSGAPVTWLFTGDSITQGLRHTHGYRSYVEHFQERIRGQLERFADVVINTGVSGSRTDDLLSGIKHRVHRFSPDFVSVMLGTNDATNGAAGRARFRRELAEIADSIIDCDVVFALQVPPPILPGSELDRSDFPAYADLVREVATERDAVLIDHQAHWTAANREAIPQHWLDDPIHPNGSGHLEMAITMLTILSDNTARRELGSLGRS